METLVIYDNTGHIYYYETSNNFKIPSGGVQYIITTIPQNKFIKSVNTSSHEPIFEDKPKSEVELLREENEQLKNSVADLWEVVLLGGAE